MEEGNALDKSVLPKILLQVTYISILHSELFFPIGSTSSSTGNSSGVNTMLTLLLLFPLQENLCHHTIITKATLSMFIF